MTDTERKFDANTVKTIFEFSPVTTCLLCGSTEQHEARGVSWLGVGFSYVLCAQCGLKYMNPRPTQKSYERFFKEAYWQWNMSGHGFRTVEGYDDPNKDQLQSRMGKYQAVFKKLSRDLTSVRKLDASTRVLEVGCAFGFSLEWLARDFGCKTFGIEPSEESRKRCAQGGVQMIGHTAEEVFVPPNGTKKIVADADKYDVIYFSHVLETLPDPKAVLDGVREHLKPDGVLLMYLPNGEYYDLMAPFTPFVYWPETITRLLALCGFDTFRVDASASPVDWDTCVRVANPQNHMSVFARPGPPRDVRHPTQRPQDVLRRIELGNDARAWGRLSVDDLMVRVAVKLRDKARRVVEERRGGNGKRR